MAQAKEPVYTWDKQHAAGLEGEKILDKVLARFGVITPVEMKEQWQGIDRILLRHGGETLTLEYKTDYRASTTGNVFIETMSNQGSGRLGWAYTTQADRIVWYIPVREWVIVVKASRLRINLSDWVRRYRSFSIANPTFHGSGIAVPLTEILAIASTFIIIPKEDTSDATTVNGEDVGSPA